MAWDAQRAPLPAERRGSAHACGSVSSTRRPASSETGGCGCQDAEGEPRTARGRCVHGVRAARAAFAGGYGRASATQASASWAPRDRGGASARRASARGAGARSAEIFINADAGGSNSYRAHVWKHQLQRLADKLSMSIHVSHFPPGTSKWNKVEHRLFSFIAINWRGRPLRTYETVIGLIGNTTNRGGLIVRARLDRRCYPIGKKVSAKDLRELNIDRDHFHGDWNYVIRPRSYDDRLTSPFPCPEHQIPASFRPCRAV
jgi:Rhodopirellula transposase DDE domain